MQKKTFWLGSLMALIIVGCAGTEASIGVDIETNTVGVTFDNLTACSIDIADGNSTTTTNCGITTTATVTAEEEDGRCKATDVKVSWTYSFSDGSTQDVEVDFGEIDRGDSVSETISIRFSNFNLLETATINADADFDSDCGGSLTGLDGSFL